MLVIQHLVNVQRLQLAAFRLAFLGLVEVFDEPWVASYLLDSIPFFRIRIQNLLNEIPSRLRHIIRYTVVTIQNFLIKFVSIGIFKRQVAAKHGVQNDSAGPYINLKALIVLSSYHFGSGVAWTAASCLEGILGTQVHV